jgi:hypothetical protein
MTTLNYRAGALNAKIAAALDTPAIIDARSKVAAANAVYQAAKAANPGATGATCTDISRAKRALEDAHDHLRFLAGLERRRIEREAAGGDTYTLVTLGGSRRRTAQLVANDRKVAIIWACVVADRWRARGISCGLELQGPCGSEEIFGRSDHGFVAALTADEMTIGG